MRMPLGATTLPHAQACRTISQYAGTCNARRPWRWAVRCMLAAIVMPALTSAAKPQPTLAQLQLEINTLQRDVVALQQAQSNRQFDAWQADRIRSIAAAAIAASLRHPPPITAGYHAEGFFIQSSDRSFQLNINAVLQVRYTFSADEATGYQNLHLDGTPAGTPSAGDASGFGLRRARLILSGYIQHSLIYSFAGDFAGFSSNAGKFQIQDTWLGWRFARWLKLRAGAMLVPFTRYEYIASGTELPEYPMIAEPFDAISSLGIDAMGLLNHNHISYNLQINNGSRAKFGNPLTLDNRLGFYARVQLAGAGTVADFHDSPDLQNHQHLVWMIAAAAGFESQNSSATAYPAPQKTLQIPGLSTPTGAGFYPPYVANGNLYRAASDLHAKYRGLAFNGAVYLQQINDALPAGQTTDLFRQAFGRSSLWQLGYSAELGQFIVPHRWEVVGRFDQLLNQGGNKTCQEYTVGLNYYLYGEHAKVQSAVTYIPKGAALTDPFAGTVANTQDIIGEIQVQLKF